MLNDLASLKRCCINARSVAAFFHIENELSRLEKYINFKQTCRYRLFFSALSMQASVLCDGRYRRAFILIHPCSSPLDFFPAFIFLLSICDISAPVALFNNI